MSLPREPLFEHYSPEREGLNTPSPPLVERGTAPLVEIGGILAGSDPESSSSSSSSDSDSDSESVGAASSSGLSGSGDDYVDEGEAAASKAARVKALKEGKKEKRLKVPKERKKDVVKTRVVGVGKGKGKKKAEGEGDTVFEWVYYSVQEVGAG
jgi:hypothetical protein